ncbi:MAG: LamG domain-containing protein [Gammaproteobacteria bacterium]|nr:LamG domain-containing protein [Gammaproteobacteria bacterium]
MTQILGYADRISVAPGEIIQFMVSCDQLNNYDVTLVRVIQGDINPVGPGYQEERIPIDLGGPFQGRFQPIHAGSYALIDDSPVCRKLSSFGMVAAVWPTTPGRGPQTIMARRDPKTGAGFELYLDETSALCLALSSDTQATVKVSTDKPLIEKHWYAVAGTYDAQTGEISVMQQPLRRYPKVDDVGGASSSAPAQLSQANVAAPLTLAARPSRDRPAERYLNGRIDSPRLFSRSIDANEIINLLDVDTAQPDLVAAWDFSIGISTDRIIDVSSHQLHGHLINLPTRGVTGRRWCDEEYNWIRHPDHYGAIHFHDDDVYDAGWNVDFSFTIPSSLHSGIYAARLHAGEEEYYVPFCVRPPRGRATEAVAFLLPTASYMAYGNNRIGIDVSETELVCGRLIQLSRLDLFMNAHPELGLCFYDLHSDGSGVYYSSRLRPIIDMQPKFIGHLGGVGSNVWQFNADTHILGWLDKLQQPFDVITDEDLNQEGVSLIQGYQVVITGSHPEYYSAAMLDALHAFTEGGGRLMYLGGNGFYWRIAFHPELPGVIECRKSEDGIRAFAPGPGEFYASFTGEYTGLWRRNGRAPNTLVGVGMVSQGFDISSPYVRTEASRDARAGFIFQGVEDEIIGDFGLSGGGAVGIEVDAANHEWGTPPHALVLASSRVHTDVYLMVPEDMLDPVPGLGGTEAESIRGDMVFFETSNGGAVFSASSIAWAGSLSHEDYNNNVAKITTNVLRRFLDQTPF